MEFDALNASKLLSDPYVMKILAASFKVPKSAQELSLRFSIPIAVCYRKIRELEGVGLMECVGKVLTPKGKRVGIYRSQVKGAYLFFEKDRLRVRLELTKVSENQFDSIWDPLAAVGQDSPVKLPE